MTGGRLPSLWAVLQLMQLVSFCCVLYLMLRLRGRYFWPDWSAWKTALMGRIATIVRTATPRKWMKDYAFVLAVLGVVLGSAALWRQRPRPFTELHDVHVLSREDRYNLVLDVKDPDSGERNAFSARFCSNQTPTDDVQAGVTFRILKYVDTGRCFDISADNLGYILRRDQNGNPVVTIN